MDLVPLDGAHGVPRELAVAADLALGAGAQALRVAWRVGSIGRSAMRTAGSLPGAGLARRAAATLARPLLDDGARTRARSVEQAQALLEAVVPAVVELIDVDAVVRRVNVDAVVAVIDVDAVVRRVDADAVLATVDLDALLARTDVNALLARVDLDAVLAHVDVDALIARIDVDAIAARIDVNAIVQRVDVDAVVEETELGTIVARSTSGFASEALDAARAQTVGADTLVTRIVERVLRRRGPAPLGPPLLVDEEGTAEPAPPPAARAASPRADAPQPSDPPPGRPAR
jgi:hydrogenase maturation factor